MQIDPTFNPEGNELANQFITQRASLSQLRTLIEGLDFNHKIAIAQLACNEIGSRNPGQLIKSEPIRKHFDSRIQAAIVWMWALPTDSLAEIAIEILEEPRDRNE